jgi:protein-tyrosine-phosphatase
MAKLDYNHNDILVEAAGIDENEIARLREIGKTKAGRRVLKLLNEEGITEINNHVIKPISEIQYKSDRILAMDDAVKQYLDENGFENVHLASEYAGITWIKDVPDPHDLKVAGVPKDDPRMEEAYREMCGAVKAIAFGAYKRVLSELDG